MKDGGLSVQNNLGTLVSTSFSDVEGKSRECAGLSELVATRHRATINNKDPLEQFMPARFYATCSFP